jgi:hypothetical protein
MLELTWNGEILTYGTAMGPEREKSWQYLVWPTFVQNKPSEELATQLLKWKLLQATKSSVSLWQGTRWPQIDYPAAERQSRRPRGGGYRESAGFQHMNGTYTSHEHAFVGPCKTFMGQAKSKGSLSHPYLRLVSPFSCVSCFSHALNWPKEK